MLALHLRMWLDLSHARAKAITAAAAAAGSAGSAGSAAGASAGADKVGKCDEAMTLTDFFVDRQTNQMALNGYADAVAAAAAAAAAGAAAASTAAVSSRRSLLPVSALPPAVYPFLHRVLCGRLPAQAHGDSPPVPGPAARAALVAFLDLPALEAEAKWALSRVDATRGPSVFCHNDLHAGNVMDTSSAAAAANVAASAASAREGSAAADAAAATAGETGSDAAYVPGAGPYTASDLTVIDFEYSGPNYRGFDLANSLGEASVCYTGPYPGFVFDIAAAEDLLTLAPRHSGSFPNTTSDSSSILTSASASASASASSSSSTTGSSPAAVEMGPRFPPTPPSLTSWSRVLSELDATAFTDHELAFATEYARSFAASVAAADATGADTATVDATASEAAEKDDAAHDAAHDDDYGSILPHPLTASAATAASASAAAAAAAARDSGARGRRKAARTLAPLRLLVEASWAQLAGHLHWVAWAVALAVGGGGDDAADAAASAAAAAARNTTGATAAAAAAASGERALVEPESPGASFPAPVAQPQPTPAASNDATPAAAADAADAAASGAAGAAGAAPPAAEDEGSSDPSFGYLEYAIVRAAMYYRRKQALLRAERAIAAAIEEAGAKAEADASA